MGGFREQKIGETTFLVFKNGMVPADQILQLAWCEDRCHICLKASGWLVLQAIDEVDSAL
jgi:hypothetical protein